MYCVFYFYYSYLKSSIAKKNICDYLRVKAAQPFVNKNSHLDLSHF